MKLWFLPNVREGVSPTTTVGARPHVPVSVQLESSGRTPREISHVMPMLGPGDVIGIEPRQVLRVTPAAGTGDAEPDFFPSIEFDAPDFPWAYSPLTMDPARRLPWIVLLVIEATDDVVLAAGERGQSPNVLRLNDATARRELPDLSDTWAWAHAQVACDSPTDIASTLAQQPDRTLSRLLAPRRLLPFRAYRACVVPAFLSGVVAGLGGDPAADPAIVTGLEPAWSASRIPASIPVYYSWTFRTGEAGDFESLAQRLHAAPLDASVPPMPLQLSLPAGNGQIAVDWEPPLRAPGTSSSRPRRPATAATQIAAALRPGTASRPVLGPAYFGSAWTDGRALTPLPNWPAELNATPMLRAAAGLGADAIRTEQDALVAAASAQFDEFRARQREGRRRQLGAAVVNRVKLRLAAAPRTETARVFAPLALRTQAAASNAGLYTAAARRVMRKMPNRGAGLVSPADIAERTTGLASRTASGDRGAAPVSAAETGDRRTSAARPADTPRAEPAPVLIPAIQYRPLVERTPVVDPAPPLAPTDPTTMAPGGFVPRFDRPLSEVLADRHPELMLPGADAIASDGVLLVESHAPFIEAFLVGANQEIGYELLWRGLPMDSRSTAFRRFWPHIGGGADIGEIAGWTPASAVGSHLTSSAALVLVVRSALVRRYPGVLVAAVPATWNADGSRSPVTDAAKLVLPDFRGRIGSDALYAGFSQPSLVDAIGATKSPGPAGWFFLLSENPGDPRFGLDPEAVTTAPTRATLAWSHLSLPPNARYATVTAFPPVPDANFRPDQATAASLASLTRQRPFRAFLHGSLLVRLPSASS
jgi:hypothetical protein